MVTPGRIPEPKCHVGAMWLVSGRSSLTRTLSRPRGLEKSVNEHEHPGAGPKYILNIEDVEHPWERNTISVPEIRTLGGIPVNIEILVVDTRDQTERTLAEDEIIELKPGQGFGRKVKFRRG